MRNYFYYAPGGGVFSRILQCTIEPLASVDFDNVYIVVSNFLPPDKTDDPWQMQAYQWTQDHINNMTMYGINDAYEHVTNYVLDQHKDDSYEYRGFLPVGTFYDKVNKIELSPKFQMYKRVLSKLKIQQEIYTAVDRFTQSNPIGPRTLGVHVRLTTMNQNHGHLYQPVTIDDYIREIERELATGNYDNVFVAADNHESINKLKQRFGQYIIYQDDFLRLPTEIIDRLEFIWEFNMFFHKRFWQESFRECMILSRCGALICRESNFSNAAIVFSNSYRKIIRVEHEL